MLQTIHDKLKGIFAVAILVALGVVFVFWGVNFTSDAGGLTRAKGIEVNGRETADRRSAAQLPGGDVAPAHDDGRGGRPGRPAEVGPAARRGHGRAHRAPAPAHRRSSASRPATWKCCRRSTRSRPSRSRAGFPRTPTSRRCNPSAWRRTASRPSSASTCLHARSTAASTSPHLSFLPKSRAPSRCATKCAPSAGSRCPASGFESAVQLDDAAIRRFYDSNQSRYMTEEQATVAFVELDPRRISPRKRTSPRGAPRLLRRKQVALLGPGSPPRAAHPDLPVRTRPPRQRRSRLSSVRRRARTSRRSRASCPTTRPPRRSGGDLGEAAARRLRRPVRGRGLDHGAGRNPRPGQDRVRLARDQAGIRVA